MDLKIGVQGDISYGNRKFIVFPIFQCFDNHTWVQTEPYHTFYVSFQVMKTALCNGRIMSLHQHCISLWGLLSAEHSLVFRFGHIFNVNSCFINHSCSQPGVVLWLPVAVSRCFRLHCRTFVNVLSVFPLEGPLCQNSWLFFSF